MGEQVTEVSIVAGVTLEILELSLHVCRVEAEP